MMVILKKRSFVCLSDERYAWILSCYCHHKFLTLMGNMKIVWLDWTFTKSLDASDWQHEMQLCECLGTCNLSHSGDQIISISSVIVRCPFPILHFNIFLKSTRPIDTSFGVKHIYGKSNLNCDIYDLTIPEPYGQGQSSKKDTFSKIYSHTCRKKSMNKACCQIGKLMALGSSV